MREGSDPCGTRTTVHLRFAMLITSLRGTPPTSAHRLPAKSRPDAEAALNLAAGPGGVKRGFSVSKSFTVKDFRDLFAPGKRNWLAGTALPSGGAGEEVLRLDSPRAGETG